MELNESTHIPVLLNETVEGIRIQSGDRVLDCTAGFGGHAQRCLEVIEGNGRMVLVDQDAEALNYCRTRFQNAGNVAYVHSNFSSLSRKTHEWLSGGVDAAIIDCGVSSYQFDNMERGFSFKSSHPLDMRMNKHQEMTAAEWIGKTSEEDIKNTLREFADERFAGRIARCIKEAFGNAKIRTAADLAEVVRQAVPSGFKYGKIHPATKTFQAIRMAVNDELGALEKGLVSVIDILKPSGRLGVISFHSVEDRLIKNIFKQYVSEKKGRKVNKHVIKPSLEESRVNPRSRSAKLRVFEKQSEGKSDE